MIRTLPFAFALLVATALPALADEIHAGNWEFTAETHLGGIAAGTGTRGVGQANTYTTCINADKPFPTNPRSKCTIEKQERHGGSVSWAATCATPQGDAHADGTATYSGDTMDSVMNMHMTTKAGQAFSITNHITGRYLGACPG